MVVDYQKERTVKRRNPDGTVEDTGVVKVRALDALQAIDKIAKLSYLYDKEVEEGEEDFKYEV